MIVSKLGDCMPIFKTIDETKASGKVRKVFDNNENFSILEIKEKNLPHTLVNQKLLRSIA